MALVERLTQAQRRSGSFEGRESRANTAPAPAPAVRLAAALEPERWLRLAQGPIGKPLIKALGVALLMLGLAAIGTFSMTRGLKGPRALASSRAHAEAATLPSFGEAALAAGVPADTANAPAASSSATEPAESSRAALTRDGKVILNLAGESELRKLPGVGQKRAQAILALRQKLGKFRRATELLRVRGIGQKRLKQMLPHFVLDPPPADADTSPSAGGAPNHA